MPTTGPSRARATSVKSVTPARAAAKPSVKAKGGVDGAVAEPAADKLVRDSFTIPKSEYTVLEALKQRAVNLKRPAKKSELLRAGIFVLQGLKDREFLAAMNRVPSLKLGRPKIRDDA